MKKKFSYITFITILLIHGIGYGQDSVEVSKNVMALHRGLVSGDTSVLHHLLDDQLTYGHSNGWIESKRELITNNFARKIIYQSISEDNISLQIKGSTAIARFHAIIKGLAGDKSFHLKLHVCQTWIETTNSWKLMARQAVKLEAIE